MATSGRGRSSSSESGIGDSASGLARPVYHVRKTEADSDLFTESAFVYTTKTWWARLTSRTALETYQGTLNHFAALVMLTIQTMAAITVAVSKQAWALGVQVASVGVQVGGAVMRVVLSRSRTAGGAVAGGARVTGGAIAGSARGVWGVMAGGARATRSVVTGGARATRSAVAGGARLARRTTGRGRATRRAGRAGAGPSPRVVQPPAPAGQRRAGTRPDPGSQRRAAAAAPTRTATPTHAAKTTDRTTRPVRGTSSAPPRPARPAAPQQTRTAQPAATKSVRPGTVDVRQKGKPARDARAGSAPGATGAVHGDVRPQSSAATTSLKSEQIFVGRKAATAKVQKTRARKGIGLATRGRQGAGILVSVVRIVARAVWRLLLAVWSAFRNSLGLLSLALRWTARRWQYVALPVAVSVLAVMLTPISWDVVGGFARKSPPPAAVESEPTESSPPPKHVTASETADPGISLPKITVPRFSGPLVTLPNIPLHLPAFVKGPVEKVDRILSGALVEPRSRVLVADVGDPPGGDEQLGLVLALVLEAELARGSYITVPPRERTLIIANGGNEAAGLALPATRALSLAASTGSAAIITSEFTVEDSARVIAIVVHDEVGDEMYRFVLEVDTASVLDVIGQAATRLAAKLGEPTARGEGQAAPTPLLTRSLPAAQAYAEARAHLYRSDYRRAIDAAGQAVAHDSAFAAAHHLMAEALGLNGLRVSARRALETAWRFRDRLSERERLRLAADRDALAGRHSEAIFGYDHLFSQFRDDAAALKSQAILQEMVGVRGGGSGNLRVAYMIDPVDWPPLERVAAFLGYRGRLPEFANLAPADSE